MTVAGIVRTWVFCTSTFPAVLKLLARVQLAVTYQSPLLGGEQFVALALWLNIIAKEIPSMTEIIARFKIPRP